jgi:DNA polymerase-3 subunit alpha
LENKGKIRFAHLHTHTEYSVLDGISKIKDLAKKASENGIEAVAITDHGNMFGAVKFYEEMKKVGVKPIIGMEAYVCEDDMSIKTKANKNYHLTILAMNETGYKNLSYLSTIAYLKGFYYKPRFDLKTLFEHNEGLISLSGCLGGMIPQYILKKDFEKAENITKLFKKNFNDRFYLEIMKNGLPEEEIIREKLKELSKKYDIPLVATNDSHYVNKEDSIVQEIAMAIGRKTTMDDDRRFKFDTDQYYFKTKEEMYEIFSDNIEALENTVKIADRCNFEFKFGEFKFPKIEVPEGETPDSYLKKICEKNLPLRYKDENIDVAKKRLERELEVIASMGFSSYFLMLYDFVSFAKKNNIPIGPGRGSGAGSIVTYLLGIMEADPIKYNLLFERFLNKERITMPDIDLDISDEKRDELINYAREKYGEGQVAQIITFGTMAARAVVRDVARVFSYPLDKIDAIAKSIPHFSSLSEAIKDSLKGYYENDREVRKLLDYSLRLEGNVRNPSTHAAGIVISNEKIYETSPLALNGTDIVTQYDMVDVEKLGLLKMDFLGLRNLSIVQHAVEFIKNNREIDIEPYQLERNDKKVFELLQSGKTTGIFQLESRGMRETLKKLKPTSFEDIIAVLSMYRPGPLGSGMVDSFIRRKNGQEKIEYEHPKLEPILKETYGVILYQEQVIRIFNELGGFSMGEADLVRRAMSKKKKDVMEKQRVKFIQGCIDNGIDKNTAEKIFSSMESFAQYGFNKSHSTGYAILSYVTAYLKANYPLEYLTSLLISISGDTDRMKEYIQEARDFNIKILPPDINNSYSSFSIEENNIRFGLSSVKNVGSKSTDAIVEERKKGKFKSFMDFLDRIPKEAANSKILESLIKVGAFDSLIKNRQALLINLNDIINYIKSRKNNKLNTSLLFDIEEIRDHSLIDKILETKVSTSMNDIITWETELMGVSFLNQNKNSPDIPGLKEDLTKISFSDESYVYCKIVNSDYNEAILSDGKVEKRFKKYNFGNIEHNKWGIAFIKENVITNFVETSKIRNIKYVYAISDIKGIKLEKDYSSITLIQTEEYKIKLPKCKPSKWSKIIYFYDKHKEIRDLIFEWGVEDEKNT